MSNVSQMPPPGGRKEKRRLHLHEISSTGEADIARNAQVPEKEKPTMSVGAALRAARLKRGEDADAVAKTLKMRRDQLEAIENDDYLRLPGRTYAVGFIRAYARYLGLDTEAMIESFKDQTADHESNKPVELVFPVVREEQRLPNGSMLIIALMIAMVIYGVSYLTMPARKSPTTAKAGEPAVAVVQPAPAAAPAAFVAGNTELPSSSLPAEPQAPRDTLDVAFLVQSAATQNQDAAPSVAGERTQTASDNLNAGPRITLKALQPTYLRIKDPRRPGSQGIVIDRVLNPGESYQAPERAGLVMQTGNAGGLQVEVDGRNVGVLGKSGEVIVQIPFDPSYFLQRTATSQ